MKRKLLALLMVITIPFSLYIFNYTQLKQPIQKYIDSDSRNIGITVDVHYKNYIDISNVVFDITSIEKSSKLDVFRVLLNFAEINKQKNYKKIFLSYKGEEKFIIPGEYFKQLGVEFGSQNPMYTIRTFPENIQNLDGKNAYDHWSGGLLGVLQKQMEDFDDFHKKWYASYLPSIEPNKNLVLDGL